MTPFAISSKSALCGLPVDPAWLAPVDALLTTVAAAVPATVPFTFTVDPRLTVAVRGLAACRSTSRLLTTAAIKRSPHI
ncbi:MAG: hypothetical protein EBU46_07905 [Nitrosomonadaceae bacterium]|nr:hypothetical protein [Nitrosomonadaceae bacterium]